MNDITYRKNYEEYKAELDGVLQSTAESFVKIGYLLKVARDTNILEESGYKSVSEFAEAEYNLNRTQVSRFISINDRFSEGGYSDHLLEDYRGYGYAKLTIMLQLPDAINEELTPKYTKSEINAIKEEVEQEQRVTAIERAIEPINANDDAGNGILTRAIYQLGEDEPQLYVQISEQKDKPITEVLPEIMAPSGDRMFSIRVRGIGRVMLSINESDDTIKLINSRSGEKESYSWCEVATAWIDAGVLGNAGTNETGIQCWERQYGRKYPVAPVQQPEDKPKKEAKPKKDTKVKKAVTDWPSAYTTGQKIIAYDNDHIGELIEKTEKTGIWKIKFPTYSAELHEDKFTEYVEETEAVEPEPAEVKDIEAEVVETEVIATERVDINEPEVGHDNNNILRGYKAAVTNNLRTLTALWEGDKEDKISLMLDALNDLKWRLEQLQKGE